MIGDDYIKLKKNIIIALIILFLITIIFTGYFLIFYPRPCSDSQCFVDMLFNCKRASWIREDSQAAWLYTIKGNAEGESCKVNIKLLKIKEGTLDLEDLQGKEMLCIVEKGEDRYPEKDFSRCSGALKEEMQDLIIKRMHNYLLKNIGEIKEEFQRL